jgi:hypothetical protein
MGLVMAEFIFTFMHAFFFSFVLCAFSFWVIDWIGTYYALIFFVGFFCVLFCAFSFGFPSVVFDTYIFCSMGGLGFWGGGRGGLRYSDGRRGRWTRAVVDEDRRGEGQRRGRR